MARIRTIKPEFFTSSDIVSVSPLARLLYIGLWCEADREGRMKWDLLTLKMRYLPVDVCDIKAVCDELIDQGLIIQYEDDGKKFAFIPTFKQHQIINNRESESFLPTPLSRVPDASKRKEGKEGKGRKGREGNDASKDASGLPAKEEDESWFVGFTEFWNLYPKKQARADAEKAWKQIHVNGSLPVVLDSLRKFIGSDDWKKEGGKYIPLPASWIRGKRWEDELTTSVGHTIGGIDARFVK